MVKLPDEFQGDAYFPDADGMDPDSVSADALQCFVIEDPQTLGGLVPVAATFLDPKQIPRKKDQEDWQEQQIVEKENQSVHGVL